jgi:hypothetical protein
MENRRVVFKGKREYNYLYALMDDETRFWIAQQVAETKNTPALLHCLVRVRK